MKTSRIFWVLLFFTTTSCDPWVVQFYFNSSNNGTNPYQDQLSAIMQQTDGKILTMGGAGTTAALQQLAIVRLLTDGTFDPSFGTGGKVVLSGLGSGGAASSALETSDGSLYIGGSSSNGTNLDAFILKLTSTGAVDTTFGASGILDTGQTDFLVPQLIEQPDGMILALLSNGNVFRFDASGNLDPAFAGGSFFAPGNCPYATYALSMSLWDNGKILVAAGCETQTLIFPTGPDLSSVLFQVLPNGTLDTTFGASGFVSQNFSSPADDSFVNTQLLANGSILVSGYDDSDGSSFVMRFSSAGVLDTTFGSGGTAKKIFSTTYSHPRAIDVAADGSIRMIVTTNSFDTNDTSANWTMGVGVVKFDQTGALVTSYGNGGAWELQMPTPSPAVCNTNTSSAFTNVFGAVLALSDRFYLGGAACYTTGTQFALASIWY